MLTTLPLSITIKATDIRKKVPVILNYRKIVNIVTKEKQKASTEGGIEERAKAWKN